MTGEAERRWSESYSKDFFWLWLIKHPTAWPLWMRRAMFVTLPVSFPLWGFVHLVVTVSFWLSVIPIAIFNTARGELWDRTPGE